MSTVFKEDRTWKVKTYRLVHQPRFLWETGSVVGTVALGSLFHFVYEWSGNNNGTAWFAATNESVWEHLKLIFWPAFLFTITMSLYQRFNGKGQLEDQDVWFSRAIGLAASFFFVAGLFYAYTRGQAENSNVGVDIMLFVLGVILLSVVAWFMRCKPGVNRWTQFFGIGMWMVWLGLFVIFSYEPPTTSFLWNPNQHGF